MGTIRSTAIPTALRRAVQATAMAAALALAAAGCGSSAGSKATARDSSAAGTSAAGRAYGGTGASDSGTSTTTAAPATGGAAVPPSLPGKVNDMGTKDATDGGTVEVDLSDNAFGPTYIKAPAGAKITLSLKNTGQREHNFTMKAANVNEDLQPGSSKDVKVMVPQASDVSFFCEYHKAIGMQGSFIVG